MKRLSIALFLLLLPSFILAQELNAKVSINTEKLPNRNRELLSNFAQVVEDYLNNTRYTGNVWEGEKIRCSFTIFFESAPDETHYSAQVSVTSQRPVYKSPSSTPMLKVMDNSWDFVYERGQSMYFSRSDFSPLTSFLDFYAYLIIGLDYDSFNMLGGSDYYDQAFNITLLGANSQFSNGWIKGSGIYSRRGIIEDLVNEKYRQFREDFFDYHYNGLDLGKKQTQDAMVKMIKNLETMRTKLDVKGVLLRSFFDAKVTEIVSNLRDYPDKSVFAMLKRIDPPHIARYDEAML